MSVFLPIFFFFYWSHKNRRKIKKKKKVHHEWPRELALLWVMKGLLLLESKESLWIDQWLESQHVCKRMKTRKLLIALMKARELSYCLVGATISLEKYSQACRWYEFVSGVNNCATRLINAYKRFSLNNVMS